MSQPTNWILNSSSLAAAAELVKSKIQSEVEIFEHPTKLKTIDKQVVAKNCRYTGR